jgi:hypothetical protein
MRRVMAAHGMRVHLPDSLNLANRQDSNKWVRRAFEEFREKLAQTLTSRKPG